MEGRGVDEFCGELNALASYFKENKMDASAKHQLFNLISKVLGHETWPLLLQHDNLKMLKAKIERDHPDNLYLLLSYIQTLIETIPPPAEIITEVIELVVPFVTQKGSSSVKVSARNIGGILVTSFPLPTSSPLLDFLQTTNPSIPISRISAFFTTILHFSYKHTQNDQLLSQIAQNLFPKLLSLLSSQSIGSKAPKISKQISEYFEWAEKKSLKEIIEKWMGELWRKISESSKSMETGSFVAIDYYFRFSEVFMRNRDVYNVYQRAEFWDIMREGLVSDKVPPRRQSLFLVKEILALLSKNKKIYPSHLPSWNHSQWGSFFNIYEALNESKSHLIQPVWSLLTELLPSDTQKETSPYSKWILILFISGIRHSNPAVRFYVIEYLLREKLKLNFLIDLGLIVEHLLPGFSDITGTDGKSAVLLDMLANFISEWSHKDEKRILLQKIAEKMVKFSPNEIIVTCGSLRNVNKEAALMDIHLDKFKVFLQEFSDHVLYQPILIHLLEFIFNYSNPESVSFKAIISLLETLPKETLSEMQPISSILETWESSFSQWFEEGIEKCMSTFPAGCSRLVLLLPLEVMRKYILKFFIEKKANLLELLSQIHKEEAKDNVKVILSQKPDLMKQYLQFSYSNEVELFTTSQFIKYGTGLIDFEKDRMTQLLKLTWEEIQNQVKLTPSVLHSKHFSNLLSLFLACLPNLKDVKDIIQIVDSDNIIKIIHFEKNEEKSYDNDHEQINENLSIRWNFITTLISGSPQISKVKLTESSKLKLFENSVHSLEIISYKSLSSLYICLSLLLHTENFLPSHYKQDELLQTIWWSFKNCKRKKPETFRHFLYLYLHPSLFQSTQPEQVLLAKKAFRNVFSLVKHSPRMSSLLAMHLCILLSSPPIALQYPSEILQLCLVSNPDESSSQELSKEKLSPPIIIICSFLATFPSNTAIIEAVVSALIEKSITDKYKIREPTTSGSTNKKKLSIWRTCCVLSPYLNENFADQYQETIWDILELQNFGNVRYYIQIFVISLMIRVPKLTQQRLVKKLEDFDMNYQLATSLVVIAAYLILHFGKMEKFGSMVVELFYKLMPWTNHYMHAVRVAAQTLVMRVIDIPVLQDVINGNEYLKNSLRFIQSNSLISRAVNSQSLILDNFNPVQLCTVEGMFFNNPDFGHETLLLDTINKALKKVRKSFLDKINSPSELPELNPETFQKRIIPWEATISHLDRALFVSEKTSTAGKPRQPLIVVASLLDNTPNIAGLVRTGEIFNVSEILIGNSKILKDPQFKRMTVSSEKHVPISEVKLNNLPEFLGLIRKSGWSVIAVEQTVDSVLLPDFVFPEKCVLVLGQEQEGIPHSLLKQVDRCVEIPQLGTVRSLNVHVSASIVIWEYTRQRLNLQQQTPKI